jgi:hypothetical protein
MERTCVEDLSVWPSTIPVAVLTITDVMTVVTIVLLETIAMSAAIVITEMNVLRTAGNALAHRPLVVPTMRSVDPGLHPPGGRLMIEGLQGTMITGAGAMMTAERLIIIMTDAGTILTDAEMTEDATRKMTATTIGRGTQMEMVDGPVNW